MKSDRLGKKLDADAVVRIVKLFYKQDWLNDREEGFYQLINSCENIDKQLLIFELLDRFCFLRIEVVIESLKKLINHIIYSIKIPLDKTQIVATTVDGDGDSAQLILQLLKPILAEVGWGAVMRVNKMGGAVKNIKKYPNIVLVDEFVGTGITMAKRIRNLKHYCEQELKKPGGPQEYSIYVCVLASMVEAKQEIEGECGNMFSAMWFKKGISDYFEGKILEEQKTNMFELEKILVSDINDVGFPSFGYGKAEALYTMEGGNTPNSVFPIFWWPTFVNGLIRKTVLYRAELSI